MTESVLTASILESLRATAEGLGLLRLGAVALDDPGFAPAFAAYERFLAAGKAGSMAYLERTRDVRLDPAQMLAGARTALVACAPYDGEPGPVARYAQGRDYHTIIHQRLLSLGTSLKVALPTAEALVFVDTKPILERAAATLAGLGFLGKHGCLIVPGLGSYVLLGGLLTTARLSTPAPPRLAGAAPWDACGECRRCLDACPTAAFDGPGDLDPRRCIAYLTIEERAPIPEGLAAKIGERIAGCDVCQEVCPYNAGGSRRARAPAAAWIEARPGGPPKIDLLRLADLGSSQHRALGRGSALRRIPRRQLRRNALIAVGNREGPASAEEAAVILRACCCYAGKIIRIRLAFYTK